MGRWGADVVRGPWTAPGTRPVAVLQRLLARLREGLSRQTAAVLVLTVLWCLYPLIPRGTVSTWFYDVYAMACSVVGFWSARRLRSPARAAWMVVLAGFAGWVLGDAVFSLEQYVLRLDFYPVPSDALYLGSYVVLGVGLLRLTRTTSIRSGLTPLLDSAIMTAGFAIVVATFFIAPIAADSTVSVLGRVVASAYPAADVLLLGLMVSLWTVSGLRSTAFRLLLLALASTLAADIVWNVVAMRDPEAPTTAWLDMLWLLGYLSATAAVSVGSAPRVNRPQVPTGHSVSTRARMIGLSCGLMLPGLTLFLDALVRRHVPWQIISIGSVLLSVLVLLRMGLLLRTVEVQAVRLAALARNDALTGAPNRRTWDHELGRAMQRARTEGSALCVALLDLDHFKRFNDEFGHQAGDRLLREAVAAWSEVLGGEGLLARYGGEEFGLLLPGMDAGRAAVLVQAMQARTPERQSFSAGIAVSRPDLDPDAVVALADRALYEAKRSGRRCVRIADSHAGLEALPAVQIALQPIIDVSTGRAVGYEALNRFHEGTPESMFSAAHRDGYGIELEAAALRAALDRRPHDGYLSISLSLRALTSPLVQAAFTEDLHGIVIELGQRSAADVPQAVAAVIADLKRRGAHIAIADWGRDYFDLDRLTTLSADAVTLNRRSLEGLAVEDQRAVMGATVRWAQQAKVKICADGIETREQWETVIGLGFDFAQGPYFEQVVPEPARDSARAVAPTTW